MSKTIRYYRHSETVWNKEGRLQGWLDSSLTEKGVEQAKAVNWDPDIVFCSDLARAKTTASLMFPNKKVHPSALLREIDLGEWQGKTVEQLQKDAHYCCYEQTPHEFQATSQETFDLVTKRMLHFHEQLLQIPHKNIAVVSHGVALGCLFCQLDHQTIEHVWGNLLPSAHYRELAITV